MKQRLKIFVTTFSYLRLKIALVALICTGVSVITTEQYKIGLYNLDYSKPEAWRTITFLSGFFLMLISHVGNCVKTHELPDHKE